MRGESAFGKGIKFAGADTLFNRSVELLGVEGLEPGAKTRQLVRRKLFDGFLDFFGGVHVGNIAFRLVTEKVSPLAEQGKAEPGRIGAVRHSSKRRKA